MEDLRGVTGIYKIKSPTGRIYIGQSVNVGRRWEHHIQMRDKHKTTPLYRSLIKYTPENHKFVLLEECEKDKLNEREMYYIKKYDSFDSEHGMNLTKGGDSKVTFSKKTLEKMSKAKKGKPIPHLVGHKHSEETRSLLAELAKGNKNWLGKNHTEETKAKIREKRKHQVISEESIKRGALARTGRKYPNRKRPPKEVGENLRKKQIGQKLNVKRTSKYYGVCLCKRKGKWRSYIKIHGKQKYIGVFNIEEDAARAYDKYVIEHIPYDIPLNFPEEVMNGKKENKQ